MIYMTGDGIKIIVLETGNIEEMLKGRPAHTSDNSVLIAWTPDPVWLADRILETDGDAKKIAALIDVAARRPQQPKARPHHETHVHDFGKDEL